MIFVLCRENFNTLQLPDLVLELSPVHKKGSPESASTGGRAAQPSQETLLHACSPREAKIGFWKAN
jgi:hypothetical protein